MADLTDVQKIQQILSKTGMLTADEVEDLTRLAPCVMYLGPNQVQTAQFRATVELIGAIRSFDKASSEFAGVTNQLTTETRNLTIRIYLLTWVMIGVGLLSAIASGWYPLVWWLTHGFRFR
jgi:hypothetical protein